MNKPIATNNFVWVLSDEVKKETGGLIIPSSGRVKPNTGEIFSVGDLVHDKKIKTGKKGIFHSGTGMPIEFDGTKYLVLESGHIIGVV